MELELLGWRWSRGRGMRWPAQRQRDGLGSMEGALLTRSLWFQKTGHQLPNPFYKFLSPCG